MLRHTVIIRQHEMCWRSGSGAFQIPSSSGLVCHSLGFSTKPLNPKSCERRTYSPDSKNSEARPCRLPQGMGDSEAAVRGAETGIGAAAAAERDLAARRDALQNERRKLWAAGDEADRAAAALKAELQRLEKRVPAPDLNPNPNPKPSSCLSLFYVLDMLDREPGCLFY